MPRPARARLRLCSAGQRRLLDAAQNARLVAAAENYYRVMYYGGAETWNLRDSHMFETLEQLLEPRGPQSKAVVWAHNSHVGDARHTEMGLVRDELNIGQLCRERFGDQAALVGFGTDSGKVACASDWDGAMEIKEVKRSLPDSVQRLCHDSGKRSFLLDFGRNDTVSNALRTPRPERFIGVIYRPETERLSHYMNPRFHASSTPSPGSTRPLQLCPWLAMRRNPTRCPIPSHLVCN